MTNAIMSFLYTTLIPAWLSSYIQYDVWDEITSPFPNFFGKAEVISSYIAMG